MADEKKNEPKDKLLARLVLKQKGKVIENPVSDNVHVSDAAGSETLKTERQGILAELKKRFPRCVFTWIG